jgi:hypothetical protein
MYAGGVYLGFYEVSTCMLDNDIHVTVEICTQEGKTLSGIG